MNASRKRARCRACGQRVAYGLNICPHCGRNPQYFHTRWRATLLSLLAGVAVGLALLPVAPHPDAIELAFGPSDTPMPAFRVPPTFTPTATLAPTATPTASPSATPTAPATAIQTRPANATNPPTATSTATPPPRPTVAPPRLVSPKDQDVFASADDQPTLQWEGTLQDRQQFEVRVRYIDQNSNPQLTSNRLRETRWPIPSQLFYRQISPSLRAIQWDVVILDGDGNAVSPTSEVRLFYWR